MNFIKDMFDLTFSKFITITIAKYVLLLFWALDIFIGIIAIFAIFPFGILVLIIGVPILMVLDRIMMELFISIIKIAENTSKIQ
jgi:hypothetical protein